MKSLIKFLKQDISSDIETVKNMYFRMVTGQPLLDPEKVDEVKKEFKSMSVGGFLKDNGLWILVVILALVVGWILAAKFYQGECNTYIFENFIKPNMTQAMNNFTWNFSQ